MAARGRVEPVVATPARETRVDPNPPTATVWFAPTPPVTLRLLGVALLSNGGISKLGPLFNADSKQFG